MTRGRGWELGLEEQAGQVMRRFRSLDSTSGNLQNWRELTLACIIKLVSPNCVSLAISLALPPLTHGTIMFSSTLFSKMAKAPLSLLHLPVFMLGTVGPNQLFDDIEGN